MAKLFSKSVTYPLQPSWWPELVASVHRARETTNSAGAAIALTNESTGEIVCYARSGEMAPEPGIALLVEDSLTAQCIRSGKQLHCRDTQTDARVCTAAAANLAARSLVITPVQQGTRVLGVLAVFSDVPGAFSPMHLAALKATADKIAGALREQYPPVAGQGPVQLLKKTPDVAQPDTSKPKPPLSAQLPLSGKEARREPPPERGAGPVMEQSAEQLPAPRIANDHSFATLSAMAGSKKEPAATRLILIVTVALLMIASSITWAYLKRTGPASFDTTTSIQSNQPGAPTADVEAQSGPAPKIDTPEQRLNTTEQKPDLDAAVGVVHKTGPAGKLPETEQGKATSESRDSARSANSVDLTPAKDAVPLSARKKTAPLAASSITPASDPQFQLSVPVGAKGMIPPITAPPAIAPKQAPAKSDMVSALLVRSVPPQYPLFALQLGISGTVTVRARVGKDGRLTNPKLLSGPSVFRKAAFDALKLWQYTPATLNGQAVEQDVEIKMDFRPVARKN